MAFLGKILKYLLRSLFSIIVFLLFVWFAKTNRDINAYITFLNSNDGSVFHWSQPATRSDPFWPNIQNSGNIADIFSGDTTDSIASWLDVYDPSFEQDLNTITDSSLSGSTEEDYWFTSDQQTTGTTPNTSTETISKLELLRQRKLAQ